MCGLALPSKLAMTFVNENIVNRGMPDRHPAIRSKFPIFIPMRSKPLSILVVEFVTEPDGNLVIRVGPQFLDELVVEFTIPFAI
jgi:hypothetical protein